MLTLIIFLIFQHVIYYKLPIKINQTIILTCTIFIELKYK